jgi:BirA family biotin operon repressor/biotin-[acetyl-CoA-carboxylase] ligase
MVLPPDLAAPLAALGARSPDRVLDVQWHPAVTSTMDVAGALAASGAPAGTVVGADLQTDGRGRRGRRWESPFGAGLYFALVWRWGSGGTRIPTDERGWTRTSPLVTLAAGVGVREGIMAATALTPELKWPNDLVVGARKLAGILAEGHAVGTPEEAVVIGVGLNVRADLPPAVSHRATSLEREVRRTVDRGVVLADVLAALVDSLARLDRDAGDILRAWRQAAPSARGAAVAWDAPAGERHGRTMGIDDTGALLIETGEGVERIVAGEVRWL